MKRLRFELMAAALGLVGVLALAAITAAPAPSAPVTDEVSRLRRANVELAAEQVMLNEAQVTADRAAQLAPRLARATWGPDSLLILEDSLVPTWEREVAVQWLRRSWRALQAGHGDVRVVAAIVLDTGRVRRDRVRAWQLAPSVVLPERLDGRTCLVEVPFRRSSRRDVPAARIAELRARHLDAEMVTPPSDGSYPDLAELPYPAQRLSLGACGWLAAYGAPGRGMRSWLDSTGWRGANAALFVDAPRARAPWRTSFVPAEMPDFLAPTYFGVSSGQLVAASCAGGAARGCRTFVSEAAPGHAAFREFAMATSLYQFQSVGAGFTEAYDPRPRLLDDVRRAIGHERFRALWRDDRALPESFAAAVGVPLDAWVQTWAREAIRGASTTGPRFGIGALAVWLLPCALLLLYTIRRTSRRQVARAS